MSEQEGVVEELVASTQRQVHSVATLEVLGFAQTFGLAQLVQQDVLDCGFVCFIGETEGKVRVNLASPQVPHVREVGGFGGALDDSPGLAGSEPAVRSLVIHLVADKDSLTNVFNLVSTQLCRQDDFRTTADRFDGGCGNTDSTATLASSSSPRNRSLGLTSTRKCRDKHGGRGVKHAGDNVESLGVGLRDNRREATSDGPRMTADGSTITSGTFRLQLLGPATDKQT